MSPMSTVFAQTAGWKRVKGGQGWVCDIDTKKGLKIHLMYRAYYMTRAGGEHRARRWCALKTIAMVWSDGYGRKGSTHLGSWT
jgi:hypothetical protein